MPERDESGFAPLPDEIKRPPRRPSSNGAGSKRVLYNLLGLAFILGSCGLIALYATVWNDPYSALNPFPPNTPFPVLASETPLTTAAPSPSPSPNSGRGGSTPGQAALGEATASPTNNGFAADSTVEVTADAAITAEANQPTLTFTPISLESLTLGTPAAPIDPSVPTLSPTPGFPFSGRVVFITNPDGRGGCAWSSISGTVVDFAGAAVVGYGVRIIGENLDTTLATGSDRGAGAGGFELQLGTQAAIASFNVQLLDAAGTPVSDVIAVVTRDDCQFNIAAVRFTGLTP